MRIVRAILRILSALLAAGFAALTLVMPVAGIFNLWNEGGLQTPHHAGWVLGLAAYAYTLLAFCIFTALVSWAFFRYARYGALRRPQAGSNSQGRDEKEALENIKEAITAWLWAEDQKAVMAMGSNENPIVVVF
jgi:predicted RNase H-like HicB family nuclease